MIAKKFKLEDDVLQLPGEYLGCSQVKIPTYADFPNNCGRAPNYCAKNDDGTYKYPT
jgi:hypothetical protein